MDRLAGEGPGPNPRYTSPSLCPKDWKRTNVSLELHFRSRCLRLVAALGVCLAASACPPAGAQQRPGALPSPLVFLADIDATIGQDIRYASANNFTGRPVPGYEAGECILIEGVARALAAVQKDLVAQGFSLKVYDCYRPERAVRSFAAWVHGGTEDAASRRFHPRLPRSSLISRGFIASVSDHSKGVAVDLTIVALAGSKAAPFDPAHVYAPCNGPKAERAPDTSVDMGTDFDCFDADSHTGSRSVSPEQSRARKVLIGAMTRHGFESYAREWWHFSMPGNEAGGRSFDVPVPPRPR